jgi:hypothetical protein
MIKEEFRFRISIFPTDCPHFHTNFKLSAMFRPKTGSLATIFSQEAAVKVSLPVASSEFWGYG